MKYTRIKLKCDVIGGEGSQTNSHEEIFKEKHDITVSEMYEVFERFMLGCGYLQESIDNYHHDR